jgi:hypothetical protein
VSGKENVFKYIRNNNLTVIKEDEENVKWIRKTNFKYFIRFRYS